MSPAPKQPTQLQKTWLQRVRQQAKEAGTIAAYAKRHGLKKEHIYCWRSRFRKMGLLSIEEGTAQSRFKRIAVSPREPIVVSEEAVVPQDSQGKKPIPYGQPVMPLQNRYANTEEGTLREPAQEGLISPKRAQPLHLSHASSDPPLVMEINLPNGTRLTVRGTQSSLVIGNLLQQMADLP